MRRLFFMKTNNLKIKIYKVIFPDGITHFESKNSEKGGCGGPKMKDVADMVRGDVKYHLKTARHGQVFIDFKPLHDMECGVDSESESYSKFCLPLSDEEKWSFGNITAKRTNVS